MRSKKYVLGTMGTSLRNFRSALNIEFIQPNKDHQNKLKLPPREYPRITKSEWKEFIDRMLGTKFQEKSQKWKQLRTKIKYNHRLGSSRYGGLLYRKKAELGVSIKEIDRSQLWLMARKNNSGGYEDDIQQVAQKIFKGITEYTDEDILKGS